ncbi:MAG TPA: hypothetical protein VGO62_16465, partial [Myxococcota bacterium]
PLEDVFEEIDETGVSPGAITMEAPAPLEAVELGAELVAEGTSSTPPPRVLEGIADDMEPAPRRSWAPLIAVAALLLAVVGVGSFALADPGDASAVLALARARFADAPASDPVVEVPKVDPPKVDPPKVDVEAPRVDPPEVAKVEVAKVEAKPSKAKVEARVEPTRPDVGKSARKAVAIVNVTSEGYAVKGGRKLYAGEVTSLKIDKDAGAPFSVHVKARVDGGAGSFDIDADPWAIVHVDGLGLGKTPQTRVALPMQKAAHIELTNPTAGRMTITLSATPLPD